MRVEIGPVSRASASAWLDYGTDVIATLRGATDSAIPAPAIETFTELIDGWRIAADTAARADGPFQWSGEQSAERVEFLMKALYETGLVVESENETGGLPLRPPEADEFHFVLIDQVLLALAQESRSHAEFVAALRNVWRAARPK